MKFDAIIGNPPYQKPQDKKGDKQGGGASLWDKFVTKSFTITKENGFISFIHPSMWRKPESNNSKNKGLWKEMTDKQILYLEIHNALDGAKTFNASTRYDWYIMCYRPYAEPTLVIDEDSTPHQIDFREWSFLPNKNYDIIKNIMATGNDERCQLIWNTFYHTATDRYDYVSSIKSSSHQYPLIHATNKDGNRLYWTSVKNPLHFGISKVIFGETGINNCVIDINGEYGMTQQAMAIKISSLDEGQNIKNAIESEKFKELLLASSWSNFRIDYRLFRYFKKDFWKEFIESTQSK